MSKLIEDQLTFIKEKKNDLNSSFNSEASFTNNEEYQTETENEETCDFQNTINSISYLLSEIINMNSKYNDQQKCLENDIFTPRILPTISILDYLNRIVIFSNIEENTLISALIYIDTVAKIKKISQFNVYKILFAAVLVALKFNEDEIYKNNYYAQIAGVSIEELLILENEFLKLIDFKLIISENTFNAYKLALERLNYKYENID